MISRKERRVQKALGTEDSMPPTIYKRVYKRIYYWGWCLHETYSYRRWVKNGYFWQWLAWKLPKRLVYHCGIRIWARATCHGSGCKEDITITTMNNAIRRWEKE